LYKLFGSRKEMKKKCSNPLELAMMMKNNVV